MSKKYTLQDFINKANKVHNFKYDYSKTKYINSASKLTYICPEHGEIEQIARAHMSGKGCWKCIRPSYDTESFINEANKVHNFKYDYSKTIFFKANKKCIIICPKHGEFIKTPNKHLQGQGCEKCSQPFLCDNTQDFINKSNKVHNFKYDYSKTKYVSSISKVIIDCPFHGEFKQVAHRHLRGGGCKECGYKIGGYGLIKSYKNSDSGKEIGSLYCVRFINKITKETFFKVGITKRKINVRFQGKNYKNWDIDIIHEIKMSNLNTSLLEKNIHKKYEKQQYIPKEKFYGWTECFEEPINLKKEFYNYLDKHKNNISIYFKELVRFYQEAGNSDIKKMETIIANSDWEGFKKMIYKVLRVSLK